MCSIAVQLVPLTQPPTPPTSTPPPPPPSPISSRFLLPSDIAPPSSGGGEQEVGGADDDSSSAQLDEDPKVTNQSIADCQDILAAAEVATDFATVFCPTSTGMKALAKSMKFKSVALLAADVRRPNSPSKPLVQKIMRYLVHPDSSMTGKELRVDKSTKLQTGLTHDNPAATLSLKKVTKNGKTALKLTNAGTKAERTLRKFDMSKTGSYRANDNTFIIHAIDGVLMPPDAYFTIDAFFKAEKDYSTTAAFFKAALKTTLKPTGPATVSLHFE